MYRQLQELREGGNQEGSKQEEAIHVGVKEGGEQEMR